MEDTVGEWCSHAIVMERCGMRLPLFVNTPHSHYTTLGRMKRVLNNPQNTLSFSINLVARNQSSSCCVPHEKNQRLLVNV